LEDPTAKKSPIPIAPVFFDPCADLSRTEVLISVSFKEVERPLQVKPWDTNFEVRCGGTAAAGDFTEDFSPKQHTLCL